ncbi:TIGR04282 family arsenosugar biosynthesis glycosyltransferase [Zobellella denitrificans]|uniref:TIGR04282 family arsenosugar biosynthesis glycosyltransferase n=1 Tax=Zobellella denitrificans TaxID=347534 RepID=UPI0020CF4589|nr:DUF2064 domain-containing protein [Zobellella denitrificans]
MATTNRGENRRRPCRAWPPPQVGWNTASHCPRRWAARRGLQQNPQLLLIGTDCPHLNPALLQAAAHRLGQCEAMFHPTCDGGYALLGLRRFSPRLFEDIPWSTDRVAELTRARIRELGWCFHQGECLRDIDEPDDLFWLPSQWLGAALFDR